MTDNVLYDLPQEFMADIAACTGFCDAQSILPRDDRYICHCTCGRWDIVTGTRDEGLDLARAHTAETKG